MGHLFGFRSGLFADGILLALDPIFQPFLRILSVALLLQNPPAGCPISMVHLYRQEIRPSRKPDAIRQDKCMNSGVA
jgi:hypothetical protein